MKSNYGEHSPGPLQYDIQDGFASQLVGSAQPNSPRYSMRARLSKQSTGGDPLVKAASFPGPSNYNPTASFGAQVSSARSTAPMCVQMQILTHAVKVDRLICPCRYGFGSSSRHRPENAFNKVVYLGKEFENENYGIHSPGPSTYAARYTMGPGSANVGQVRTAPSFSFGVEERF